MTLQSFANTLTLSPTLVLPTSLSSTITHYHPLSSHTTTTQTCTMILNNPTTTTAASVMAAMLLVMLVAEPLHGAPIGPIALAFGKLTGRASWEVPPASALPTAPSLPQLPPPPQPPHLPDLHLDVSARGPNPVTMRMIATPPPPPPPPLRVGVGADEHAAASQLLALRSSSAPRLSPPSVHLPQPPPPPSGSFAALYRHYQRQALGVQHRSSPLGRQPEVQDAWARQHEAQAQDAWVRQHETQQVFRDAWARQPPPATTSSTASSMGSNEIVAPFVDHGSEPAVSSGSTRPRRPSLLPPRLRPAQPITGRRQRQETPQMPSSDWSAGSVGPLLSAAKRSRGA